MGVPPLETHNAPDGRERPGAEGCLTAGRIGRREGKDALQSKSRGPFSLVRLGLSPEAREKLEAHNAAMKIALDAAVAGKAGNIAYYSHMKAVRPPEGLYGVKEQESRAGDADK